MEGLFFFAAKGVALDRVVIVFAGAGFRGDVDLEAGGG